MPRSFGHRLRRLPLLAARQLFGLRGAVAVSRYRRAISLAWSRTLRLVCVGSVAAAATSALIFPPSLLSVVLPVVPVLMGSLVFMALGLLLPGLHARQGRVGAPVLAALFLACVVGVKWTDEGATRPFIALGNSPRTDFLWFHPLWIAVAWIVFTLALVKWRKHPKL